MDERAFYRRFGEQLRAVRNRQGVTQADLAGVIGMSRTSITNMEQGNQPVQLDTLYRLARAMRVDVTDLLPEDEPVWTERDVVDLPDEVRQFVERVREGAS